MLWFPRVWVAAVWGLGLATAVPAAAVASKNGEHHLSSSSSKRGTTPHWLQPKAMILRSHENDGYVTMLTMVMWLRKLVSS